MTLSGQSAGFMSQRCDPTLWWKGSARVLKEWLSSTHTRLPLAFSQYPPLEGHKGIGHFTHVLSVDYVTNPLTKPGGDRKTDIQEKTKIRHECT